MRSVWFTPDVMDVMKIVYRSESLLHIIINLYVLFTLPCTPKYNVEKDL